MIDIAITPINVVQTERLDRHAVVVDVVARRLGAQHEVITNVLLDEAVAIVAANHRIGQVHIFDLGLQFAPIMLADPAPEDHRDLVGLSDCCPAPRDAER